MHVFLWTVFTLVSVCNAQRADDPNSAAKINDQLRRETLPTVEKKAATGDADAQLELALGYSIGGYLPKNDKLAADWCSKAARQGNVAAETTMGYLYSTGKGVPHSDKEAIQWWQRAADQGSADAQFNLGEFYGSGRGTKRDYKEAVKWFRKAAEQGEPDAQYHLGLMYEAGNGVTPDTTEALRWYHLSAAQGFADARQKVDEYAQLFPPQHEFSLGDQSPLSVDQALEQMAKDYSDQATDRAVRDDIAFPANAEEYKNLGKHAILLLAAVTHDPAELPIARVYLEKEEGVIELQKVGSFLCRTPRGSVVERVLGPYRENAFYLLPISSYFQRAKLVIDFARNRSGFQLIQFPEEVKTDFVLADSDHGQGTMLHASIEAVNAIVLREYGIDLTVRGNQTK
jgi:TPR repeat protein